MSSLSVLRSVTDDLTIRKELDLIALYIGAEDLTDIQATAAIDFIKTQFGGLVVSDISQAVKMALAGKLNIQNLDYTKKLSAVWLGKVLRAYSDFKTEYNRRNPPIKPDHLKLESFTGVDGQERGYYERLEAWYLEHGEMPEFWPYSLARKWIKDDGLLVTKEDKNEVERMAIEYLADQPTVFKRVNGRHKQAVKKELEQDHLDRAVLELHLKRKHGKQDSKE